ncbi:Uncharacterised protein r2_g2343 [Pycnogonum litorale]
MEIDFKWVIKISVCVGNSNMLILVSILQLLIHCLGLTDGVNECLCDFRMINKNTNEVSFDFVSKHSINTCDQGSRNECKKTCLNGADMIKVGQEWKATASSPFQNYTVGEVVCLLAKRNFTINYGILFSKICSDVDWKDTGAKSSDPLSCKNGKPIYHHMHKIFYSS